MVCAASTNGPTVASGRIGNLFVFRKGGIADAGVKPSPGPPPSRRPKLIRPGSREGPGRRLGTPPRKDRLPHLKSQMDTLNVHLTFQFTIFSLAICRLQSSFAAFAFFAAKSDLRRMWQKPFPAACPARQSDSSLTVDTFAGIHASLKRCRHQSFSPLSRR